MRPPLIKRIVDDGLRLGMTNAEMVAAHPQYRPKSIINVANRRRRELGTTIDRFPKGPGIQIPLDIRDRLRNEAAIRDPDINAHKLVLQLLRVIVTDNLFDAILGEPACS